MLEKCGLTIQELNLNQRLGHKKTKLNICHHMLTSSTQLQNRSIYVVEKTRTSSKCQKMKNARAKRAKILFFIVKYANLWGFCSRRRRGCLSSLLSSLLGHEWWGAGPGVLLGRGASLRNDFNFRLFFSLFSFLFYFFFLEYFLFQRAPGHLREEGMRTSCTLCLDPRLVVYP